MSLVDKFTFEKHGARGCSDSHYTFQRTTCCGAVGVADDELDAFYWDPEALSHCVSLLEESTCPFCRRSDWHLEPVEAEREEDVPEQWRWACETRPRAGSRRDPR